MTELLSPLSSQMVITIQQVDNNVITSYSGTLNTSAISGATTLYNLQGQANRAFGALTIGSGTGTWLNMGIRQYGFMAPVGRIFADENHGAPLVIDFDSGFLTIPSGYGGWQIEGRSVYYNRTIAELGFRENTSAVFDWGGAEPQSRLVVNALSPIVTAVPEAGETAAIFGAAGLLFIWYRRKFRNN